MQTGTGRRPLVSLLGLNTQHGHLDVKSPGLKNHLQITEMSAQASDTEFSDV